MGNEQRRANLRKHGGGSHDDDDHGNWADGGGGSGSKKKSRFTIPGRSLQRELYPRTDSKSDTKAWPSTSGKSFGQQVKSATNGALVAKWKLNNNGIMHGRNFEEHKRYARENANIEREIKRRGDSHPSGY